MKLSEMIFERGTYFAFVLSEKSRSELLKLRPPSFSKALCHHVTCDFSVDEKKFEEYKKYFKNSEVKVMGYLRGKGVECFSVEIDGHSLRPAGENYHVTLSVEPPLTPRKSNDLFTARELAVDEIFTNPIIVTGQFKLVKK